jgi:hypothetical protein
MLMAKDKNKPVTPPVSGMAFDTAEMKKWDEYFKKIGAGYGVKKHSLSAKVYTYFGLVWVEFVTIEYEWDGGRKVGHSGRDFEELEKNITETLKILYPYIHNQ